MSSASLKMNCDNIGGTLVRNGSGIIQTGCDDLNNNSKNFVNLATSNTTTTTTSIPINSENKIDVDRNEHENDEDELESRDVLSQKPPSSPLPHICTEMFNASSKLFPYSSNRSGLESSLIRVHKFLKEKRMHSAYDNLSHNFRQRTIVLIKPKQSKSSLSSSNSSSTLASASGMGTASSSSSSNTGRVNTSSSFGFNLQSYGLLNASTKQVEYICFVSNVQPDSPAKKAGLENGDVIMAIDDILIEEFESLKEILEHVKNKNELRLVAITENVCKKIKLQQRKEQIKFILNSKLNELAKLNEQEKELLAKYKIEPKDLDLLCEAKTASAIVNDEKLTPNAIMSCSSCSDSSSGASSAYEDKLNSTTNTNNTSSSYFTARSMSMTNSMMSKRNEQEQQNQQLEPNVFSRRRMSSSNDVSNRSSFTSDTQSSSPIKLTRGSLSNSSSIKLFSSQISSKSFNKIKSVRQSSLNASSSSKPSISYNKSQSHLDERVISKPAAFLSTSSIQSQASAKVPTIGNNSTASTPANTNNSTTSKTKSFAQKFIFSSKIVRSASSSSMNLLSNLRLSSSSSSSSSTAQTSASTSTSTAKGKTQNSSSSKLHQPPPHPRKSSLTTAMTSNTSSKRRLFSTKSNDTGSVLAEKRNNTNPNPMAKNETETIDRKGNSSCSVRKNDSTTAATNSSSKLYKKNSVGNGGVGIIYEKPLCEKENQDDKNETEKSYHIKFNNSGRVLSTLNQFPVSTGEFDKFTSSQCVGESPILISNTTSKASSVNTSPDTSSSCDLSDILVDINIEPALDSSAKKSTREAKENRNSYTRKTERDDYVVAHIRIPSMNRKHEINHNSCTRVHSLDSSRPFGINDQQKTLNDTTSADKIVDVYVDHEADDDDDYAASSSTSTSTLSIFSKNDSLKDDMFTSRHTGSSKHIDSKLSISSNDSNNFVLPQQIENAVSINSNLDYIITRL